MAMSRPNHAPWIDRLTAGGASMRLVTELTLAEGCATAAVLCRAWPDHRSNPYAADRRNPDHLSHVLVSPRVLCHQHRDVRADRGRCVGLPSLRDLPSGTIVPSSECRVARLCPGDRLCAPLAIDHRHELACIRYVASRLGRVRQRPFAAFLLLRYRRQPSIDTEPLSRGHRLWGRPARRGSRLSRCPGAPQLGQRSFRGALDRGLDRRGCAVVRYIRRRGSYVWPAEWDKAVPLSLDRVRQLGDPGARQ